MLDAQGQEGQILPAKGAVVAHTCGSLTLRLAKEPPGIFGQIGQADPILGQQCHLWRHLCDRPRTPRPIRTCTGRSYFVHNR